MATMRASTCSAAQTSRAARPAARTAVVVRATADRRVVLGGMAAAVGLSVASAAQALSSIDLFDDRKAKATGFDLIYEARDLSLSQSQRDGFVQARASLEETKKRVKESEKEIDTVLEPFIKKAYWTEAREQLRRRVGTLRFDLNTLASAKGKEAKKSSAALQKDFIAKVEDLDYSLRKKEIEPSLKKLASTKNSLDSVLAALL